MTMVELNPGGAASLDDALRLRVGPDVMRRVVTGYTLANSGAVQPMFEAAPGGGVALLQGLWQFEAHVHMTGMSGTSGNAAFLLQGDTAVLAAVSMHTVGRDDNTPTNSATIVGSYSNGLVTNASMLTSATATSMAARLEGMFRVTTAGRMIPSLQLATAAAAVLQPGSYFHARRVAAHDDDRTGAWT